MKIAKSIVLFLLNFIFFVLPFLVVILGTYKFIECKILDFNICDSIFEIYGFNIYFILILGFLISTFSFLSNFLEKNFAALFSIFYSFLILIFTVLTLNFGSFKILIKNFFNLNEIVISFSFDLIFYFLILGIIIDIVRKFVINFLMKD